MTAVRITPDQARRLGITLDTACDAGPVKGDAAPKGRRSRRRRVPYHTVCADCHEHFTTEAAETRHLDTTRHANYQLVLDLEEQP